MTAIFFILNSKSKNCFIHVISVCFILNFVLFSACSGSHTGHNLVIFAAGGARPAVDAINEEFNRQYTVSVDTIYGGGGEVLSKMMLAKKGDIFIAPDQRFMQSAAERKAVDLYSIKTVAYLIPVIAVKKGNPKEIHSLADLANKGVRLAITRPETTLVGSYAPEIFRKSDLENAIMPNIATYASDPNNLLTILIMGQVDAGIIWHFYGITASDNIEIIYLNPEQLIGIGKMQIAVSAYCKDPEKAIQYVDFAASSKGKMIFKQCGYIVEEKEVKRYWH